MADERLRELERRFQETGLAKDEVAWLRERLRAGDLGRDELTLAASLGHAPAAAVLAGEEIPQPKLVEDADYYHEAQFKQSMKRDHPWLRLVFRLGWPAYGRLGLALARLALPEWRALHPQDRWAVRVVRASEAYVQEPSLERFRKLRALKETDPAREELLTPRGQLAPDFPLENIADRVYWSYKRVFPHKELGSYHAVATLHKPSTVFVDQERMPDKMEKMIDLLFGIFLCQALNGARMACGEGAVHAALRAEVVPWALGTGDPVRERAQARSVRLHDPSRPPPEVS